MRIPLISFLGILPKESRSKRALNFIEQWFEYKAARKDTTEVENKIDRLNQTLKHKICLPSDLTPELIDFYNTQKKFGKVKIKKKQEGDIHKVSLTFTTPQITIEHRDRKYDFGQLRVKLYFYQYSDKSWGFSHGICNGDKKSSGYCHPHVNYDGWMCLGDGVSLCLYAMDREDFGSVMTIVHSVLSTYNSHSPYRQIENWSPISC